MLPGFTRVQLLSIKLPDATPPVAMALGQWHSLLPASSTLHPNRFDYSLPAPETGSVIQGLPSHLAVIFWCTLSAQVQNADLGLISTPGEQRLCA